jgi:hypothetical protein
MLSRDTPVKSSTKGSTTGEHRGDRGTFSQFEITHGIMPDLLVTVATFQNEMEFLLARTRLESAGIECFAADENMLRMAGWHSHILGGIKLQVAESEVQDALAILRETAPTA